MKYILPLTLTAMTTLAASAVAQVAEAPAAPAAPVAQAAPALPVLAPLPQVTVDVADLEAIDDAMATPPMPPMNFAFQEPMPAPMPAPHVTASTRVMVKATPIVHDANYDAGLKAMDEGRWNDAIAAFDKSAAQSPTNGPAVLYWKAYNLEKLGRKGDATATCNQLIANKEGSVWKQECLVLDAQAGADPKEIERAMEKISRLNISRPDYDDRVVEINRDYARSSYLYKSGEPIDPNDEVKLIALQSVLQQDPAKALPVLHDMIFNKKSPELRRRALFLLARSKNPDAQAMLVEAAKNNADPDLQRLAVQSLGMKGKASAPDLKAIYLNATDNGVKRAALNGLFVANDAQTLVDLARAEKDISLKKEIVSQLAIMKDPVATAYMEELLK